MTEYLAQALPSDDVAGRAPPLFAIDRLPSLLHLSGELDAVGAPALASALEPLIGRGGIIEIDLGELSFLDSTGINALCEAAQQLGERGRIVVSHPTPSVRKILELTGVIGIIDVIDEPSPPQHLD